MSPFSGIIFLLCGVAVFAIGAFGMVLVERARHRPGRTVAHFQRSRRAMRKIFRAHVALREAARARAFASHPSRARRTNPARGIQRATLRQTGRAPGDRRHTPRRGRSA